MTTYHSNDQRYQYNDDQAAKDFTIDRVLPLAHVPLTAVCSTDRTDPVDIYVTAITATGIIYPQFGVKCRFAKKDGTPYNLAYMMKHGP